MASATLGGPFRNRIELFLLHGHRRAPPDPGALPPFLFVSTQKRTRRSVCEFIAGVSHLLACTAGLPLAACLYTSPVDRLGDKSVDRGRILILRYGRALKTGAFFRFGRQTTPIPEGSLVSSPTRSVEERKGITVPART